MRTGWAPTSRKMPTFGSWTVSTLALQDLPGIHQPMRVERGLDVAHEVELHGRLVHGGGVPLGGTEAMLCTDAAACGGDVVVKGPRHLLGVRQELRVAPTERLAEVVVQVPVP